MEFCILEEIEWRVMQRCSTTSSLLFMTGLLNNLPGICVETLGTCIIHSYSQVPFSRGVSLFLHCAMPVTTFFQVRIFPIPGEEEDGGKKSQAAAVQGGEEDVPMRDRYIVMHQVCALFPVHVCNGDATTPFVFFSRMQ
jgi:hypothetical protein